MCMAVWVFCPAKSPEPRARRLDKYVMLLLLLLGIVIFFFTQYYNIISPTRHPPTNACVYTFSVYVCVGPCHIFITLHRLQYTAHRRSYLNPPDRVDIYYYILQYNIRGIYTCFQTRYGEGREGRYAACPTIIYCIGMRDYYHNYAAAHPFKSKILVVVFRFPYSVKKILGSYFYFLTSKKTDL